MNDTMESIHSKALMLRRASLYSVQVAGRGVCVVWCLLLCCLWVSTVRAQSKRAEPIRKTQRGGDFDPASTAWNGLSSFVQEAKKLGLRVESPQSWDWSRAQLSTPIVIMAPRDEELSIKPLKRFIADGGRVFLADDFGAGDRLWESFGLEGYRLAVEPTTWKKQKYVDLHRTFPIHQNETDLLLRQAGFLFLNVPQWLIPSKGRGPQALLRSVPYRSNRSDRSLGGKVLWRISHGKGKLIVCSDPSAFINQMIAYGDNHRLARNVLHYLSAPTQTRRLILLWGKAEWRGSYHAQTPRGAGLSIQMWDGMTALNSLLTPLPAWYAAYPPLWNPDQPGAISAKVSSASWAATQVKLHQKYLGSVALLLSLLLICLLGAWVRFAKMWSATAQQPIDSKALITVPHRFEEQLESYQDGSLSYLGPLVLLKEELVLFLADSMGLQDQFKGHSASAVGPILLDIMEQRLQAGELPGGFRTAMPQLRRLITKVPGRHQWGSLEQRSVDAQSLKMYYNTAMLCLKTLGLEEEFRATRWQARASQARANKRRAG